MTLGSYLIEVIVLGEQPREAPPGVKHPRLHGVLRYLNDLGDIFDGPMVIVDEIDDLAMLGREPGQALARLRSLVHLQHGLFRGGSLTARVSAIFSSSSTWWRRRRVDSALKRAIDMIQVNTAERPSKAPAWRHTSIKVSLTMSSAAVKLPTSRVTKRKTPYVVAIVENPNGAGVASRNRCDQGFIIRRAGSREPGGGHNHG